MATTEEFNCQYRDGNNDILQLFVKQVHTKSSVPVAITEANAVSFFDSIKPTGCTIERVTYLPDTTVLYP